MNSLSENKKYLTVIEWALWIVLIIYIWRWATQSLFQPDTWWHLASGKWMFVHKEVLRQDVFSHTLFGQEWIDFEWLGQLIAYLIYDSWGVSGLISVKAFLCIAALVMFSLCLWECGVRGLLLWILVWIGFNTSKHNLTDRPELSTLFFLPFLFFLLLRARTNIGGVKVAALIGGVICVWCNSHGGFIYGVALIVLINIGSRLAKEPVAYRKFMDQVVVCSMVGMLINPYGAKIFDVFLHHYIDFSGTINPILEWQQPSFEDISFFVVSIALLVASCLYGLLRYRKETLFFFPSVLIFSFWGVQYLRNGFLIVFVGFVFVAVLLSQLRLGDVFQRHKSWAVAISLATMLVGSSGLASFFPRGGLNLTEFPVGASEFIKSEDVQGKMFNSYGFGGYLNWELGPDRKVFMDGRYIFYPLLIEYVDLDNMNTPVNYFERYLDKYAIDYAVIDFRRAGLRRYLLSSSQWAKVYEDPISMVILKKMRGNDHIISKYEK